VIACALGEAELSNRQNRWLQLRQRATTDIVTTANGLPLLFRAAPGVEEELRQLAELERDCCAFADWSVHARGEELALDVTADSEEGIASVQAMSTSSAQHSRRLVSSRTLSVSPPRDRSSPQFSRSRWAGSLHLREADEAHDRGRGFASSDLYGEACAAVGVSLRQRSDEVAADGQAKREAAARVGCDDAGRTRDRVARCGMARKREAGVRERAPGVAAGRSLLHGAGAAE
jgi:hypothetical protein